MATPIRTHNRTTRRERRIYVAASAMPLTGHKRQQYIRRASDVSVFVNWQYEQAIYSALAAEKCKYGASSERCKATTSSEGGATLPIRRSHSGAVNGRDFSFLLPVPHRPLPKPALRQRRYRA